MMMFIQDLKNNVRRFLFNKRKYDTRKLIYYPENQENKKTKIDFCHRNSIRMEINRYLIDFFDRVIYSITFPLTAA